LTWEEAFSSLPSFEERFSERETLDLTVYGPITYEEHLQRVQWEIGTPDTEPPMMMSGCGSNSDPVTWSVGVQGQQLNGAETAQSETASPVTYRFTRNGSSNTSSSLTVYYALTGTATRGDDYTISTGSYNVQQNYGSITIASGQTYVDLTLNITNDNVVESTETVVLTLLDRVPGASSSAYTRSGTTTVNGTITDNDVPQYVNTYTINTLQDVVNANDGVLSLREAVTAANGSNGRDLITFANGLQGTITLNGTQLALTDNVDIIGPGSGQLTISGNNQSRIFYSGTTGKTITLEGLTLTNGHSIGSGGAVSFDYASGVLRDVVIVNSSATTSGGGIYAGYSSNLILENCVIENNAASSSGYGGGIQTVYCYNVAIADSVIADNTSYYGGGIGLNANVHNTIDNTIIHGNTSHAGGGIHAIRTSGAAGTSYTNDTIITNSWIIDNTAAAHAGGAFFQYSENVTVADSVISGNVANNDGGGGIYLYASGHSLVTGSTIANNSSAVHGGGVIAHPVSSGVFASLQGEVEIIDTTFPVMCPGGMAVGFTLIITAT